MGFTKHLYESILFKTRNEFTKCIKEIKPILPRVYTEQTILEMIKKYYPFEWRILGEQYIEYTKADERLQKFGKKRRYNMQPPEKIILNLPIVRKLLSDNVRLTHKQLFDFVAYEKALTDYEKLRLGSLRTRQAKIEKALNKTQQMEPVFLDKMMGCYERKNATQKDRMYILLELEKYYCPIVISFFKKIAHKELNFQLREEAVRHLLSFGHYARLRKQKYMQVHTDNKKRKQHLKKEYAKERFSIRAIPDELEYRIKNNFRDQKFKSYDYFISHSYKDHLVVQKLIEYLNKNNKNVYCDWICDTDYLKRKLVCDATLSVIEKRLDQSKAVLLVMSADSYASKWVKYELNYFAAKKKTIYVINAEDIGNGIMGIEELKDNWFIDPDYRNIKLYPI